MHLLFYYELLPHHKNINGLKLMCESLNIKLTITKKLFDVLKYDYNILIINDVILKLKFPKNIKIIYGPQCWIFPPTNLQQNITYNSLSQWNKDLMIEFNNKLNYVILPFAVDIHKFKNDNKEKIFDCIFYIKHRTPEIKNKIILFLNKLNLKYIIFEYGKYIEDDYIFSLNKIKFMIVLDAHESQGFALQEAMAMNIPLLVLDINSMKEEYTNNFNYTHIKNELIATSVPYFDETCGIILKENEYTDFIIFKNNINLILNNKFNPRNFVINNLSPLICMKRILELKN